MPLKETLYEVIQEQGNVIPFHDPNVDWAEIPILTFMDELHRQWGFPAPEEAAEEGVGVYVMRYLHPDSARQLNKWLRDRNIPNLQPQSKLHVSMYRSGHTPEKPWNPTNASPIHVLPEHTHLFQNERLGRLELVLGIDNPHFAGRRRKIRDFMERPDQTHTMTHMLLSPDVRGYRAPFQVGVPKFPLVFGQRVDLLDRALDALL